MARTTINLNDKLFGSLKNIARRENRSTPNLIETVLLQYLNEGYYVDEFEMAEINQDTNLKKTIQQSLVDYKNKRGRFV